MTKMFYLNTQHVCLTFSHDMNVKYLCQTSTHDVNLRHLHPTFTHDIYISTAFYTQQHHSQKILRQHLPNVHKNHKHLL
jgi:hypothetical protein